MRRSKIIFAAVFFLNPFFTTGQRGTPTAIFHGANQVCHFSWVTQQDYILELFPDSAINILVYEKNYESNSMTKLICTGRFIQVNDTFKIVYLAQHNEIKFKEKIKFPKISYIENDNDTFQEIEFKPKIYMPTEFILKDSVARALYYSYPLLRISSIVEAILLEAQFKDFEKKYKPSFN